MNQKLAAKIKEQISDKKPKPKWYFIVCNIFRDALLFILWIALVIATGFFANILIDFQINRLQATGREQFFVFFSFFPIEILIMIVALIIVIYYLFRNLGFFYRLSSWIVVILIFCSVGLGYFIAEKMGANKTIINSSIGQMIYNRQGRLFFSGREDVVVGVINKISEDYIEIQDFNGKVWQVLITNDTDRRSIDSFTLGERVWVLGEKSGSTIYAQIIRNTRYQPKGRQMRGREINGPKRNIDLHGNQMN